MRSALSRDGILHECYRQLENQHATTPGSIRSSRFLAFQRSSPGLSNPRSHCQGLLETTVPTLPPFPYMVLVPMSWLPILVPVLESRDICPFSRPTRRRRSSAGTTGILIAERLSSLIVTRRTKPGRQVPSSLSPPKVPQVPSRHHDLCQRNRRARRVVPGPSASRFPRP